MYDNADDIREKTENARKKQNYNDFVLSMRLEIINNASDGIHKAIFKVSKPKTVINLSKGSLS